MPRSPQKSPRRQARQQRSRETIGWILEAAARVLRARGYGGTSTNHIAEAAGVSVGTIYQYFGSKDEIFDVLAERYFGDVLEGIRADPPATSGPFEAAIRQLVTVGVRAQRHGPELLHALEQVPNAVFRRRLSDGKRHLIGFVHTILESYRTALRPIDLDRAATLLVNAAEGIGYNAGATGYDERLIDDLTTLIVRYLVDNPTSGESG